jgi:hypothetical protein
MHILARLRSGPAPAPLPSTRKWKQTREGARVVPPSDSHASTALCVHAAGLRWRMIMSGALPCGWLGVQQTSAEGLVDLSNLAERPQSGIDGQRRADSQRNRLRFAAGCYRVKQDRGRAFPLISPATKV